MAKRKRVKGNDEVTIDGKKYSWANLPDEVKKALNHVSDLDNKINSAQFNVDQLIGGREFWMSKVTNGLDIPNEAQNSQKL